MRTRTLGVEVLAALLVLAGTGLVSADVSAGASGGGSNPTGVYCPGAQIWVNERAGASASASTFAGSIQTDAERRANVQDGLLTGGVPIGIVADSTIRGAGAALQASTQLQVNVGASKTLTMEDVGDYTGVRWGESRGYADDGGNWVEFTWEENVPYAYSVRRCWMMPPDEGGNDPEVLDPSEIS